MTTTTKTPTFETATQDQILAEIARQGERYHLLWELASDGRTFCGIEFTVTEYRMEDSPLPEAVKTFIDDVDLFLEYESETPEAALDVDDLEGKYGEKADEVEGDN